MAIRYCWSGAVGLGTGLLWVDAYTTLTLAFAGVSAGDTIYVAHDHAESTAGTVTLTSPGTTTSPCSVICVNRAGSVPPVSADLATTGAVNSTGAGGLVWGAGYTFYRGLLFTGGSGAVTSGPVITGAGRHYFRSCSLIKGGTNASGTGFAIGNTSAGAYCDVIFDNTKAQFGNTGDSMIVRQARFRWINTASAISGATFPTTLITSSNAVASATTFEGVDLSALGSTILVGALTAAARISFKDCKLGSGFVVSATQTVPGVDVILTRCDSGDTSYRSEKHSSFIGKQTTEITIVKSSGASDGTTPISWKIETTADVEPQWPFECLPIVIWNDTTGSAITLTIEGVWDAGAVPNDDDIWMDVEYLGTSGFPLGSYITEGKADVLATAAAQDSSTVTWTTTGLATPVKFKLVKAITPQEKGPITVYVRAAKASSTFYVDPKITVS